jgi:hypothetical protein
MRYKSLLNGKTGIGAAYKSGGCLTAPQCRRSNYLYAVVTVSNASYTLCTKVRFLPALTAVV